jgi:hypothetical protein
MFVTMDKLATMFFNFRQMSAAPAPPRPPPRRASAPSTQPRDGRLHGTSRLGPRGSVWNGRLGPK